MNSGELLDLWREALLTIAIVSAPFLIAALVVGVAVGLFQTATQLQESALAFVPKIAAALLVLALGGNLLLDRLSGYTRAAITSAAHTRDPSTGTPP